MHEKSLLRSAHRDHGNTPPAKNIVDVYTQKEANT